MNFQLLFGWNVFYLTFTVKNIFTENRILGLPVFFEHFKYAIPLSSGLTQFLKKHSLMHYIVSEDNLWILLILLYLMCFFSSYSWDVSFYCLFSGLDYDVPLQALCVWLPFLKCVDLVSTKSGKFLAFFLQIFLLSTPTSSPSKTLVKNILDHLKL